jgi:hypothetical protein
MDSSYKSHASRSLSLGIIQKEMSPSLSQKRNGLVTTGYSVLYPLHLGLAVYKPRLFPKTLTPSRQPTPETHEQVN